MHASTQAVILKGATIPPFVRARGREAWQGNKKQSIIEQGLEKVVHLRTAKAILGGGGGFYAYEKRGSYYHNINRAYASLKIMWQNNTEHTKQGTRLPKNNATSAEWRSVGAG